MNFSEEMFYEDYLTSDFDTCKHCYFKPVCPTRQNGVENRDKAYTVLRKRKGNFVLHLVGTDKVGYLRGLTFCSVNFPVNPPSICI